MDKTIPNDIYICQICSYQTLQFEMKWIAGQDHALRQIVVCEDCDYDFELWAKDYTSAIYNWEDNGKTTNINSDHNQGSPGFGQEHLGQGAGRQRWWQRKAR